MYHTGMQQPNEETYPGPLLVNIDRPYPHREWPTINSYNETITNRHPWNDAAACVRCVLHPLPLPLSSCLGCIPPLIGLPFLRFYAVVSSLFLLFVFSFFFVWPRLPLLPSTRPWTSAHPPWPPQPKPQPWTPLFSNPPLCQTPGCRSVHSRSTLSPSHPVLSALRPQGFTTRVWFSLLIIPDVCMVFDYGK